MGSRECQRRVRRTTRREWQGKWSAVSEEVGTGGDGTRAAAEGGGRAVMIWPSSALKSVAWSAVNTHEMLRVRNTIQKADETCTPKIADRGSSLTEVLGEWRGHVHNRPGKLHSPSLELRPRSHGHTLTPDWQRGQGHGVLQATSGFAGSSDRGTGFRPPAAQGPVWVEAVITLM